MHTYIYIHFLSFLITSRKELQSLKEQFNIKDLLVAENENTIQQLRCVSILSTTLIVLTL